MWYITSFEKIERHPLYQATALGSVKNVAEVKHLVEAVDYINTNKNRICSLSFYYLAVEHIDDNGELLERYIFHTKETNHLFSNDIELNNNNVDYKHIATPAGIQHIEPLYFIANKTYLNR